MIEHHPRGTHPRRSCLGLLLGAGLLLGTLGGGCTAPETSICPSGLVCPPGTECAANQDICIRGSCGNGRIDAGEVCDDGNVLDGDNCSADCLSTEDCGNGILDPDEVCDDGNNENGDGCSADCFSDERCGNGKVDVGEACDVGNNEDGDGCSANCRSTEECGNGIVDRINGEVCDDGNQVNNDDCSNDCTSTLDCGNGIVDVENGEECDDGNDDNGDDCVIAPNTLCKKATCGDGWVQAGVEECDGDGRGQGGETPDCNADCTLARCGDGIVNAAASEVCDDGPNNGRYNYCNDTCTKMGAECGDGKVNGPEACDDGDGNSDTTYGACGTDCSGWPAGKCGDGKVDPEEVCDDGNTRDEIGPLSCAADCQSFGPFCGDSHVDDVTIDGVRYQEECDEGNDGERDPQAGDGTYNVGGYGGCTRWCTWGPYCGDNNINWHFGERCDLGDGRDHDWNIHQCHNDCSGYCGDGMTTGPEACDPGGDPWQWQRTHCHWDCSGFCGDGIHQEERESCDNGQQNDTWALRREETCNADCTDYGQDYCGNGIRNPDFEECDDGNTEDGDGCDSNCAIEP